MVANALQYLWCVGETCLQTGHRRGQVLQGAVTSDADSWHKTGIFTTPQQQAVLVPAPAKLLPITPASHHGNFLLPHLSLTSNTPAIPQHHIIDTPAISQP
jgi:hypothetical protein